MNGKRAKRLRALARSVSGGNVEVQRYFYQNIKRGFYKNESLMDVKARMQKDLERKRTAHRTTKVEMTDGTEKA